MILSSPNPKLISARAVRIQARVVRSAAARLRVLANSVLVLDICAGMPGHYFQARNRFDDGHRSLIPFVLNLCLVLLSLWLLISSVITIVLDLMAWAYGMD